MPRAQDKLRFPWLMDQAGEQEEVSFPDMSVLPIHTTNTKTTKQWEVGVHACRRPKEEGRKSEKVKKKLL